MDIVYKRVFARPPDGLVSAYARGKAEVVYVPGQWVESPPHLKALDHGLFVFKTLQDAVEFCHGDEIWTAEAENLREPLRQVVTLDCAMVPGMYTTELKAVIYWPTGTMWADRVKLVEKVWDYYKDYLKPENSQ